MTSTRTLRPALSAVLGAASLLALTALPGRLTAAAATGRSRSPQAEASSGSPQATGSPQVAARRSASGRSRGKATRIAPPTLEGALRARMNRPPFRNAGVGVIVVSLRDGTTLYEKNAARPLVPASTMKVLTSAAALDRLGPDWRYETRLLSAAPVGPDGVLDGDLFVKGACAPDFVVERMPEFADALAAAGVREIRGDVVADLLYFDGEQRPPEWPHSSNPNPYAAPISALAANFSTVRVTVTPGPRLGAPAEILVEPLSDAILVSGRIKTTSTGRAVHASRRLERGGNGEVANRIVVSGRIGLYSGPWEAYLPIENPAAVAVAAVKRALQGAGIVVQGQARIGAAPEGAITLGSVPSKPLGEIVRDMNKHSQNFIAEMMQRTLGGEVFGPPASREKGARAVQAFLRSCGVDPGTVQLTDGSGLSHSNLLTAEALARVLVRMRSDTRLEASFVESLPIGGVDGTLERRMFGSAFGRVRAKTGSVAGVTTLAGYVDDTSEGPVAFAFLVNGASHGRARAALDDLCRILCTPRQPPAPAAAPVIDPTAAAPAAAPVPAPSPTPAR